MSQSRFLLVLSTAGLATLLFAADRVDRTALQRRTSSLRPPVRQGALLAILAPPAIPQSPPPPPPPDPVDPAP